MAQTSKSSKRELVVAGTTAFSTLKAGQKMSEYLPQKRTRSNLLYAMSHDLVNSYKLCNPKFRGLEVLPQRVLTNPSEAVLNNGLDNEDSNLICKVHDTFKMDGYYFTILDLLGTGTFGQVFRCMRSDTKDIVAVKVVKNKPAYQAQGLLEIKVARLLNEVHDPNDERHIVRLLDSFEHHGHVCLVFELLSLSLLDVLTQNQFRGLPLVVVQRFTKQILTALVALEEADVIHCDLKPENILLVPAVVSNPPSPTRSTSSPTKISSHHSSTSGGVSATSNTEETSVDSPDKATPQRSGSPVRPSGGSKLSDVKVIDFGSACFEGKTVYSYIQSRFYRSPEVLLGLPYNGAIDMWSLACVCAEMFLGLPLFPGVSQHNQLFRIVEMLGLPPDFLIEGKNGRKYFALAEKSSPNDHATTEVGKSPQSVTAGSAGVVAPIAPTEPDRNTSKYRIKTAEEYASETNTQVPVLRKYLRYNRLEEVIMRCPLAQKSRMTQEQKTIETIRRHCFLDFLQGLFRLNPFERWTARQAFSHPFIQNTKFSGPYVPPLDMKTNERKLDFMVLTQRKPPPSTFEAPALTGVRAPSNFSTGLGNSSNFTPLLLAHRRLSDPGLDHSAKAILEGGGPQLLKRGSPAHLKVEAQSSSSQAAELPSLPPPPAAIAESAVPFASGQAPNVVFPADNTHTPSATTALPTTTGIADRNSAGSVGGAPSGCDSPTQNNRQNTAAQAIMRANTKCRDSNFSVPPPPVASPLSQSFQNSPQVQTQRFFQQHQQQILHQQQQSYLKHRSNAFHNSGRGAQQGQGQNQHHQQQHQQQQQQQVSQSFQQNANFDMNHPAYRAHYSPSSNLQYNMTHQMSSSMSTHASGGLAMPGSSLGNSYSPYGTVGSMQDGSSVIMTDFGLALMRPDMDENRRLQSQQQPMHPGGGYWHHSQMQPSGVYGSPVTQSSIFSYGNQYTPTGSQQQHHPQHQHQLQQQQHHQQHHQQQHHASSYAYAPNMSQLASNYATAAAYNHNAQHLAGSYDSKVMMTRRQNVLHAHDHNTPSAQGNASNHNNYSKTSHISGNLPNQNASSPQQHYFKSDSGEASVNHNNLKRLSFRVGQKDGEQSMKQGNLGPHNPDIRRPSPAYHKDERAPPGACSGIIKIAADFGPRVETPNALAGSYVESPNRTSFHTLRQNNNSVAHGTSFIEQEMERRDSFVSSGIKAGKLGPASRCSSSGSNSTTNSATNSASNSRQNSSDSTTSSSNAKSMFAANSTADQRTSATAGVGTRPHPPGDNTSGGNGSKLTGRTSNIGSTLRRRDPTDRPLRDTSGTSNATEDDVLEEWDPFFEADDLSTNASS